MRSFKCLILRQAGRLSRSLQRAELETAFKHPEQGNNQASSIVHQLCPAKCCYPSIYIRIDTWGLVIILLQHILIWLKKS